MLDGESVDGKFDFVAPGAAQFDAREERQNPREDVLGWERFVGWPSQICRTGIRRLGG